jgi:MFS family permease
MHTAGRSSPLDAIWRIPVRMRGPAGPLLRILGLAVAGGIMIVGGLALPAAAFVAIGLIAGTVACLAGGAASERSPERRRRAASEAAVAAAATVAAALVLAGLVVLLGGALAVPLAAGAGVAALLLHLRRRRRSRPAAATPFPGPAGRIAVARPVQTLSTGALGREWLLSSAALGVLLDAGVRQAVVHRREELLDELERRDPAGFARWMAAGPLPGSDPADYLHGDAAAGRDAA